MHDFETKISNSDVVETDGSKQQKTHTQAASSPRRKVKSGCLTCKRRKIKCDEGWPACKRCQSTGRVCFGYGIWGGGSTALSLQHRQKSMTATARLISCQPRESRVKLDQPVRVLSLTGGENENFDWFLNRSAKKLPGVFACLDWTTILFQASVNEPAIRHATIALSSAHREEVQNSRHEGTGPGEKQALFTLAQYSKAINCLQPLFNDSSSRAVQLTLISCALFVWVEYLRAHYTNALLHLQHGLNLLTRSEARTGNDNSPSSYIEGWLITMFSRLLLQAKLAGQLLRYPCHNVLRLGIQINHERFQSMHHARRGLEHIMLRALDIEQRSSASKDKTRNPYYSKLLVDQHAADIELQNWLLTFDATIAELTSAPYTQERFAYQLLRLYYYLTAILVGACVDTNDEQRFDKYDTVFHKIIVHCIDTHKILYVDGKRNPKGNYDPEPSSPNSVSDIGWIAPLYYTAIKCRNHRLRHQAIDLLASSYHKEGIWNSRFAVAVARRVVEIEEGVFYEAMGMDLTFDVLEVPTPTAMALPKLPVELRMSEINMVLPNESHGRLFLSCCRLATDKFIEWFYEVYDLRTQKWTDRVRTRQELPSTRKTRRKADFDGPASSLEVQN